MKVKISLVAIALVSILASCGDKKKSYDEMGSNGLTVRTENMQANLRTYLNKGCIVGQQYATLRGIGWQEDSCRSDIYSIISDRPACSGYDISGIECGKKTNNDNISFAAIRKDILAMSKAGGLVLLSWTAPDTKGNDEMLETWTAKLADYLGTLQDGYGIKAPVVLFLYPLGEGKWYDKLSAAEYKKLYESTMEHLRDNDVTNAIFGYSQDAMTLKGDFFANMPDNDIDVVNVTIMMNKAQDKGKYSKQLTEVLPKVVNGARERNIVTGLTTGERTFTDKKYFYTTILDILHKYRLSYLMFGSNHGDYKEGNYYVPYPGCDNDIIADFTKMYNDDSTVFMSQLNGLYLSHGN